MKLNKLLTAILSVILILAPIHVVKAEGSTSKLIIHVHRDDQDYSAVNFTVGQLGNDEHHIEPTVTEDYFGKVYTYEIADAKADAYLSFKLGEQMKFAGDKRYVRASNNVAEVWIYNDQAKGYGKPFEVTTPIKVEDGKLYIELEDLKTVLGSRFKYDYRTAGYNFNGGGSATRIYQIMLGNDYYEVNPRTNRWISNSTTNATNFAAENISYFDVEGIFVEGTDGPLTSNLYKSQTHKYYLGLNTIERYLQHSYMIADGKVYLIPYQHVIYDKVMEASPEDVGFDSEMLKKAGQYIKFEVDARDNNNPSNLQPVDGLASGAYSLVVDGKLISEYAYGWAKKTDASDATDYIGTNGLTYKKINFWEESKWEPVNTETLYDLASNSKMYITNLAIQKLVSEGLININDKIIDYPIFKDYWKDQPGASITGKATITIKDVLMHNAGLYPDPEYPNMNHAYGGAWYQVTDDKEHEIVEADKILNDIIEACEAKEGGVDYTEFFAERTKLIEVLSATPLYVKPRSGVYYSDLDYMVLGLIVEVVTGMPLNRYVENEIYAKMGISDTWSNPLFVKNADGTLKYDRTDFAATEIVGNTRQYGTLFDNKTHTIIPNTTVANHIFNAALQRDYTLQGEVHDEKAWYTMGGVAGHAGLFSNVGDMAEITQMVLNGGIYNGTQFFTEEVQEEFVKPHNNTSSYALGWRRMSYSGSGYTYFHFGFSRSTIGHQGWTGTLTAIDPLQNVSLTILTNMRHSQIKNPAGSPNTFEGSDYGTQMFRPINGKVFAAWTLPNKSLQLAVYSEENQVRLVDASGTIQFGGGFVSNGLGTSGKFDVKFTNWTVTDVNGNPTDAASIDENGLLTAHHAGKFIVNANYNNETIIAKEVEILPEIFTVSFDANFEGSEIIESIKTEDGTNIELPVIQRPSTDFYSYDFVTWNTAIDGSGDDYSNETPITKHVQLYAIWHEHLTVAEVETGNQDVNINFNIISANGKGYTAYISTTGEADSYVECKANYNSKGVHINKLEPGTYFVKVVDPNGVATNPVQITIK